MNTENSNDNVIYTNNIAEIQDLYIPSYGEQRINNMGILEEFKDGYWQYLENKQ